METEHQNKNVNMVSHEEEYSSKNKLCANIMSSQHELWCQVITIVTPPCFPKLTMHNNQKRNNSKKQLTGNDPLCLK
jgi:hypothetical protein